MQSLKNLQVFGKPLFPNEKRGQRERARTPAPIIPAVQSPDHFGRPSAGELTPTSSRPGEVPSPGTPHRLYAQSRFVHSQPNLRSPSSMANVRQASGFVAPLMPQTQHEDMRPALYRQPNSVANVPQTNQAGPEVWLKKETSVQDLQRSRVAKGFGHHRAGSSVDTADSSHGVLPDYSSSITSGLLSRGPSTISTAQSELEPRRMVVADNSVQQDFFLSGLKLTEAQRGQLLISLPERVLQSYVNLYLQDLEFADSWETWDHAHADALAQERQRAFARVDLFAERQELLLKACKNILNSRFGDKRLCRFMRWLLQPDVEEQTFMPARELMDIGALTQGEMRALLEPLGLDASQQARLQKHFYVPSRATTKQVLFSPSSYQYREVQLRSPV